MTFCDIFEYKRTNLHEQLHQSVTKPLVAMLPCFLTQMLKTLYDKFLMVVRHMKLQDEISSYQRQQYDLRFARMQRHIDELRAQIKPSKKSTKSRIAESLTSRERFKDQYKISWTDDEELDGGCSSRSCYLGRAHSRVCLANNDLEMAQQEIIKLKIENLSVRDDLQGQYNTKASELEDIRAKLEESQAITARLQQSYQEMVVHSQRLHLSMAVQSQTTLSEFIDTEF
jgi:hypothetical protein